MDIYLAIYLKELSPTIVLKKGDEVIDKLLA